MADLVALDLEGGQEFVDQLRRVWDAGHAAFPVDQRLDDAAKRGLFERFGVARVVGSTGDRTTLDTGRPVEPGDALVVATSGSTGEPKGVVLAHDAVEASARATSDRLAVTSGDHWLACLPLSHVGGLSVVTRALHAGTRLTVHPGFDAASVDAADATLVSLVATAMRRVDTSRFRTIVLGGSRPPDDRPANAVITYGMTETGSGVVYDRSPLDGVELRIVDDEVQVRGPMLLRCYRDGVDPKLPDGWLPTGDRGEIDGDGVLHVHGRADDLVITGGENVWPEPVEQILRDLPGVDDAAIAGEPDDEWGQVVTAYLVVGDDTSPPSLDQLREAVRARLPAFHAPRRLRVVSALPRTPLGKLRRSALTSRRRSDTRG